MDHRVGIAEVAQRLGIHRKTIGRWYLAGKFPRPHYLGQRRRWWWSEIAEWEQVQGIAEKEAS